MATIIDYLRLNLLRVRLIEEHIAAAAYACDHGDMSELKFYLHALVTEALDLRTQLEALAFPETAA